MSEGTEAAAPQSNHDIVASTIESLEAEDSGASESSDPTPAESTADPESQAHAPAVTLSEEEALLHEFGFKHATKPDGRQHYIPRDKVLKMIASGLKRGNEKWTGEKTALEKARDQYKADIDELYTGVRGDPKAFLEMLSGHDPRYRSFLEPPKVEPPPPPQSNQMPEPDLTLQDGSKTYSIEGLKKLLEWNTGQVETRLLPKVDERLRPLTEREERAKSERELHERTQKVIADAQTWPGFKDHEGDILKVLQEDSDKARAEKRRPTLSLEAAYRQVVVPKLVSKLAEDDATRREQYAKEQNEAAKTTPAITKHAETTRKAGPRSSRDIVAETLAKLEKGGA